MITKIYKYPLEITDRQWINIPEAATIRKVAFQGRNLFVWAEIVPDTPMVSRCFHIYGTGHPIENETGTFLDTVFDPEQHLVWHVFDRGTKG